MRNLNRFLLIALLCSAFLSSHATGVTRLGRWDEGKKGYVYTPAKLHSKKSRHGTTVVVANNTWGVVFPDGASNLAVDHVDCSGSASALDEPATHCMGWVATRGELRVRATVRYGWFDGFDANEDDKPVLELFVHRDSKSSLPRVTDWTPEYISEFTVRNKEHALAQLFDPKQLKLVTTKKKLFIEMDSDLLLDNIGFGSECGIRYQAKVIRATPWKDAKTVAQSKGWEPHC